MCLDARQVGLINKTIYYSLHSPNHSATEITAGLSPNYCQ